RRPAAPALPSTSPPGRVHAHRHHRGLLHGGDRLYPRVLHARAGRQLAQRQLPPRLHRPPPLPDPPRINPEPHPRTRRGRLAIPQLAAGAFDVALRLLPLAFPFHLLIAGHLAAGIFNLAFDFVFELAHLAPPIRFGATARLLRNIITHHSSSGYFVMPRLGL